MTGLTYRHVPRYYQYKLAQQYVCDHVINASREDEPRHDWKHDHDGYKTRCTSVKGAFGT